MVDEITRAVRDEYQKTASEYDSRWAYYVEATRRETLNRIPDQPYERIVDVACGTGSLLQSLSEHCPGSHLTGVDLSPAMLREARRKCPEDVQWVTGLAGELPLRSNSTDLLVSCNSFHFFPEPGDFLTEARRILVPNGTLVLTDWCDDFLACKWCDWYLRWTDEAHTRLFGRRQMTRFLNRNGFHSVKVDRYKIDWLWGLMTAVARTS